MRVGVLGMAALVLLLVKLLGGCAPMWIAAGVEIEHDQWCNTHQMDRHCQ